MAAQEPGHLAEPVGESAYFSHKNNFLRMAVQFSIAQGDCAARNIINSIKAKPLDKYKPVDMGYIIPMAISPITAIWRTGQ